MTYKCGSLVRTRTNRANRLSTVALRNMSNSKWYRRMVNWRRSTSSTVRDILKTLYLYINTHVEVERRAPRGATQREFFSSIQRRREGWTNWSNDRSKRFPRCYGQEDRVLFLGYNLEDPTFSLLHIERPVSLCVPPGCTWSKQRTYLH